MKMLCVRNPGNHEISINPDHIVSVEPSEHSDKSSKVLLSVGNGYLFIKRSYNDLIREISEL